MTLHVARTEPYAWPCDGQLAGGHLALVLAGWDAGWAERCAADPAAPEVAARCGQLASAVAALGGLVVLVAHAGAAVADLPSEADPEVVTAPAIDALYGSSLEPLLRRAGRTHLLVAGHGLEGPVHSTLRSANDRGYECLLVTDACSSLDIDLAEAAAKTVTMSGGIFGAVGTTGPVLDALAEARPLATPVSPTTLVTAQEA